LTAGYFFCVGLIKLSTQLKDYDPGSELYKQLCLLQTDEFILFFFFLKINVTMLMRKLGVSSSPGVRKLKEN